MAGQYLTREQSIAFAIEAAPCTPPASWPNDGTPIEFVSIDLGGIKEEQLVDPTAESRALAVGNRARRKGRRNGTFTVVMKQHGTGVVTADGATVAQTALGTLWAHCLGGVHLGTSHVITGGSATAPELDSVAGIVPGCMLAFEDTTTPSAANDGFPVCRRVLSISTLTVTLSEALPWTPEAGDPVHGCITVYPSATVLRDAVAAASTVAWYVKLGDDVDMQWRLDGCVHSAKLEGLSLGALPTFTLEGMNANFLHGGGDGLTNITDLGTPEGQPQLSMSLEMSVSIQEVGTTTVNELDVNAVSVDLGIPRTKVETVTGKTSRFHGLATYSVGLGQTRLSLTLATFNTDWYDGQTLDQRYRITLTQPGSGAGAGSGFCLHLPNARIVETPGRADVGDNHGVTIVYEASEAADTTGGSNVDLQKARFVLAMF
jgi:hypothetical protein